MIEIVNVDYSTRELFNEISTLINTRIGSKPIEFKIEVDDKLPPVLYGDSMRIKQILTNLLTNSVKLTPSVSSSSATNRTLPEIIKKEITKTNNTILLILIVFMLFLFIVITP